MLKIPSGEKLRRKCRQKGIPTYMSKNILRTEEELRRDYQNFLKLRRESYKWIIPLIAAIGALLAGIGTLIYALQN